jgi:hypothetical protein
MRLIIAGGRDFDDYDLLRAEADKYVSGEQHVEIVCGMARGADLLGKRYAEEMGFKLAEFPADWGRHKRRAGYVRNKEMAEYATHCLCFWDGSSSGTGMMIGIAEGRGMPLRVVRYSPREQKTSALLFAMQC